MPTGRRHSGWTRLLAAVMSLALVLGSVIGMAAHATEHRHHHVAGDSAGHDHSVMHDDLGARAVGAAGCHAEQSQCSTHTGHADCGDLVCHGSWAFAASHDATSALTYARVTFSWVTHAIDGASAASLDRPPKTLVHA